ncbi:nucleotidyl transferase AbiEii/AbiGii toxin family protein [Candidatus Poribacteria bacterium]|nr:nucleotidyl transferase AbiEii/AbiGii toxin family protein [Candidatus Poribacteria bacterium]
MLMGKGIITDLQREILEAFAQLPDSPTFYLTGGTALAEFYLGHRRSYDLDLFTSEMDVISPFSRSFERELSNRFQLNVIRRFQSFVEFEVIRREDAVRLQLALDTPYRFNPPLKSYLGVMVNDYKDLIVDKLLAFFGRAEPRDAVDLFFILKDESVDELLSLAKKKDPGFDLYWFAVSLNRVMDFPDEIDRWPVEMILKVEASEIKRRFSSLAREIMSMIGES